MYVSDYATNWGLTSGTSPAARAKCGRGQGGPAHPRRSPGFRRGGSDGRPCCLPPMKEAALRPHSCWSHCHVDRRSRASCSGSARSACVAQDENREGCGQIQARFLLFESNLTGTSCQSAVQSLPTSPCTFCPQPEPQSLHPWLLAPFLVLTPLSFRIKHILSSSCPFRFPVQGAQWRRARAHPRKDSPVCWGTWWLLGPLLTEGTRSHMRALFMPPGPGLSNALSWGICPFCLRKVQLLRPCPVLLPSWGAWPVLKSAAELSELPAHLRARAAHGAKPALLPAGLGSFPAGPVDPGPDHPSPPSQTQHHGHRHCCGHPGLHGHLGGPSSHPQSDYPGGGGTERLHGGPLFVLGHHEGSGNAAGKCPPAWCSPSGRAHRTVCRVVCEPVRSQSQTIFVTLRR